METITPMARLAEALLGQPVEQFVRTRRNSGRSWRLIARDLYDATDHQVDVTHETVRTWFPDEQIAS
jgi:hypothetical protein